MDISLIVSYITTNWVQIAGVIYAILNIVNARLPESKSKTFVAKMINFIAFLTRDEAPGTLKKPFSHGESKDSSVKLNFVPILVLILVGLSACSFCKVPANSATVRCQIERSIVKCGPSAGGALMASIPYIVSHNWTGLVAMLWQEYPDIAQCVSDAIAAKLSPVDAAAFAHARAKYVHK